MGVAITSQELDIKKKNLRRWCQDIENLTQACEKLDTKQRIERSENISYIEEESLLRTEVFKTEEFVI